MEGIKEYDTHSGFLKKKKIHFLGGSPKGGKED